MPLPKKVFEEKDAWDLFAAAGEFASKAANRRTRTDHDWKAWYKTLPPNDFALAFLWHFMGTWENAGTILHQADCWGDRIDLVNSALRTVGCEKAILVFEEAIKLNSTHLKYIEKDEEIPEKLLAAEKALNARANADVTYAKLAAFVRAHRDELFEDGSAS